MQGVKAWNHWRIENPGSKPELFGVNLSEADLRAVDFKGANLGEANFNEANLNVADFAGALLHGTSFMRADLAGARFDGAKLEGADLRGVHLGGASLIQADLSRADLTRAFLRWARFSRTTLKGADFSGATLEETVFATVDLRQVKGLETVRHQGPSEVGVNTIFLSDGNIPEIFLRGAGVPENLITYMHSLASSAFEHYSCFISYSSKDQEFAERLHADLQANAVRCWYAPKDLKIGDRFHQRIDDAIRQHDKLLVVLSEASVSSSWVEKEVEAAFEKERAENSTVLFPIRLDDAVMKTSQAWAAEIRRTRHIGDFSQWHDHNSYKKAFERLLRDLHGEQTKAKQHRGHRDSSGQERPS